MQDWYLHLHLHLHLEGRAPPRDKPHMELPGAVAVNLVKINN